MSTSSVRRMKERGGAGGKITAEKPSTSKPRTPNSEKSYIVAGEKNSAGKANPVSRSSIRGMSQKPAIQPMPRMDRPSACAAIGGGGVSATRCFTSSAPRGRSSSPSDFTRILSDLRKNNASRASLEGSAKESGKGLNGFRILDKVRLDESNNRLNGREFTGLKVVGCSKENINIGRKLEKPNGKVMARFRMGEVEKELELTREKGGKTSNEDSLLDDCSKEPKLCSNTMRSTVNDCNCAPERCGDDCSVVGGECVSESAMVDERCSRKLDAFVKPHGDINVEKNWKELVSKGLCVENVHDSTEEDVYEEKRANEGVGGRVVDKYSIKLREKLAYLEGKVKRIASDIRRTEEMLDKNNPDASKMMISDIQEKILGIEKAMGHVIADSGGNLGAIGSTENVSFGKTEELNWNKQANCTKLSAKGLSSERLEARLFPHHKLLRDRTSVKESSLGSQPDRSFAPESNCESSSSGTSLNPADENLIALEFLASLSKQQSKVDVSDAHVGMEAKKFQVTEDSATSVVQQASSTLVRKHSSQLNLMTEERPDEFDDSENKSAMIVGEEIEYCSVPQLNEIGRKISTGGWFVSEGESVLLAHDDGSCTFYDIANREEKAEYKPPSGIPPNVWRDCWTIRASSADGCSGKFVVAASAGNTMDTGFCSWDFYTKEVRAFHVEEKTTNTSAVQRPLSANIVQRRNDLSTLISSENQQWWYRPCGPLIIATASCQRTVKIFDIRDGEQIMKWDVQKPVLTLDYSSPLQWRNRGKVVIAEAEAISLWDVSSLNPQALLSVSSFGHNVSAVHIHNTDAEAGGGIRQRVTSSEAEGNDGVFCTHDSIYVLDFRKPSGVGLKIPQLGSNTQSVFSRGDSIFMGCSTVRTTGKKLVSSQVQQLSLRKQKLVHTYVLPESNAHFHHTALTQVWGNANIVMGVCGLGLFVFDSLNDEVLPSFTMDYSSPQKAREIIGPDDLYAPSFDYSSSQVLLISRDRPAVWRLLPKV
ncbi:hypothetical protein Nepgr_020714 [Nepenthes gracilis]|uniref:At4g14310 8-bladed propeller domain-containing protein n=1 Tax=Nepenthes gracilis TaxID=150966 RepID=A0AAD3SVR5_NEPGR|nr:hypothetical protein Nepgr_020714 [Nepenthes gracilis]